MWTSVIVKSTWIVLNIWHSDLYRGKGRGCYLTQSLTESLVSRCQCSIRCQSITIFLDRPLFPVSSFLHVVKLHWTSIKKQIRWVKLLWCGFRSNICFILQADLCYQFWQSITTFCSTLPHLGLSTINKGTFITTNWTWWCNKIITLISFKQQFAFSSCESSDVLPCHMVQYSSRSESEFKC